MERFFEKITRALVENGNIREEEEEVYQYALKSMLILGGNILLSLMIGVCMGMPGYCVLFLCMLVPLRSDAGGYHAPNLFICYLLSFASLILTMFWAKETSVFQLAIVSALALGSLLLIFLKYFKLYLYDEGFVVQMPEAAEPEKIPPFQPQNKLFHVLKESTRGGDMLGIETVGALNDYVTGGSANPKELLLVQEAMQEKKIAQIAEQIANDPSKKFVMIAGPSSSGKTTFSNRLSIQLLAKGRKPHPISLDDYYDDRERCPRDADGNLDFECLEALDVRQFNEDMTRLLAGEKVDMPSFNFKTGKREYRGRTLQLKENDILVIEGIHGLNDKLSYTLPAESKFKIYISALTQLNIDEHNPLSTTDCRLLRRIVRDARTRGTTAQETIAMWKSVRRGEEKNIFPFQDSADVMFNSALLYEVAVLKVYAEPLLFQIPRDSAEYLEAKRLLKFLDYFLPLPTEGIAQSSLVREFVGGSCFNV